MSDVKKATNSTKEETGMRDEKEIREARRCTWL